MSQTNKSIAIIFLGGYVFSQARNRVVGVGIVFSVLLLLSLNVAHAANVGFQPVSIPNGNDQPLAAGVWYPTNAQPSQQTIDSGQETVAPNAPVTGRNLPLVVISHGSGGSFSGHYDTAIALVQAGFVVAAVRHRGDSLDDHTHPEQIWVRPQQLKRLTDYILNDWPNHTSIDASRIGAFGFSAGGFTVLVAAGAMPDLNQSKPYCRDHPSTEICTIVRSKPEFIGQIAKLSPSVWIHDDRIRAIVVAAPSAGFSFGKQGLADVRVPVQLWSAEFDHVLPAPDYGDAVRAALPISPEYHVVANADHYDFLPVCGAAVAHHVPQICTSRPGFDRAAFHEQFNRDIVTFFEHTLAQ